MCHHGIEIIGDMTIKKIPRLLLPMIQALSQFLYRA
jgi:hypothetical protein